MTQGKADDMDLGFLRAYAEARPTQSTTTLPELAAAIEAQMVRVLVSATSENLNASFDPVSSEQDRLTRALNQAARLGYTLPTSSTR